MQPTAQERINEVLTKRIKTLEQVSERLVSENLEMTERLKKLERSMKAMIAESGPPL